MPSRRPSRSCPALPLTYQLFVYGCAQPTPSFDRVGWSDLLVGCMLMVVGGQRIQATLSAIES